MTQAVDTALTGMRSHPISATTYAQKNENLDFVDYKTEKQKVNNSSMLTLPGM